MLYFFSNSEILIFICFSLFHGMFFLSDSDVGLLHRQIINHFCRNLLIISLCLYLFFKHFCQPFYGFLLLIMITIYIEELLDL